MRFESLPVPYDCRIIYRLVAEVPKGEVASYGMIASLIHGVTSRMVGRALSQLEAGTKTPWHRIVQSSGRIAPRPGAAEQRDRLAKEGVTFRKNGAVEWKAHCWKGPSQKWIEKSGADIHDVMETIASWSRK